MVSVESWYAQLKLLTYMSAGALCYGAMEVLSRGFTHISMGLLGGICFVFIGFTGSLRRKDRLTLLQQLVLCTMFITVSELLCGLIANEAMGLGIWDYSDVPLNYKGQICLPFSVLWFGISYLGALADEWLLAHILRRRKGRKSSICSINIIKPAPMGKALDRERTDVI